MGPAGSGYRGRASEIVDKALRPMLEDHALVGLVEPLGFGTCVYRKVALRILPLVMLGMFVSYIDRANLGVIAVPLSRDLGLTAASFGLAAGFFYIGYLLFEIPSNMLLAKVGARIWLALMMVTWGIVTVAMAWLQIWVAFRCARHCS